MAARCCMRLERANLFVVPLDDQRQWYRYHHLFADVLRARLQEAHPDQSAVLHRRASAWYEQNALPTEAVRHALAAGDFERAADQIELAWPDMRRGRQDATLRGWLLALPDALIRRRPVLSVYYAWVLLVTGALDAVEPRLRDAEHWLDAAATGRVVANEEEFRKLPAIIEVYRAALAQALGDVAGQARHARLALDRVQDGDHLGRAAAAGLLALAYWADGDLVTAQRSFAEVVVSLNLAGNIADAIGSTLVLSDMLIAQGSLREARRILDQAWQLAVAQGEPMPQSSADLLVALGELHRERNELDAAEAHLARSKALGERAALPENRYRWHVVMARIVEAHGDLDGALDRLNMAERLYLPGFFPEVRPIAALKARIWIAQNRLAEAQAWAQAHILTPMMRPLTWRIWASQPGAVAHCPVQGRHGGQHPARSAWPAGSLVKRGGGGRAGRQCD